VYQPEGILGTRNRRGITRDPLRGDAFEGGFRRLADRLPILWQGTVIDAEFTTGRFGSTMTAPLGSKRSRADLRFVAFDVPILAGVDLRPLRPGRSAGTAWSCSRRLSSCRWRYRRSTSHAPRLSRPCRTDASRASS
jgi:hypothetical protein